MRLVAANLPAQPASLSSSAAQPASLSGREMRDLMNAWRKGYRSWIRANDDDDNDDDVSTKRAGKVAHSAMSDVSVA